MDKKRTTKKRLWWIGLLAGLIVVNFLAARFHQRVDLTQEKRYSLSEPTKTVLRSINEPVRVDVFLKGEFPAGFRKLANSIEEFLQECREYNRGNIQYTFIDPLQGLDDSAARRAIDSINYFFGITPLTLQAPGKIGDEQTQKLVLPGAVVHYRDTSIGINFLKGQKAFGTEPEQLALLYNNVEASLEYNVAHALQKITATQKPVVGYAVGHGEVWGYNVDDAVRTLISDYTFDTLNLKQAPYIPAAINALVILKPTQPFTDGDKLKIDQYILHGGKVFWMIDAVYAEFDSLYKSGGFIAFDRGLGLEDLLFTYGVRINQTLMQDMQSDKLPQVSGEGEGQQRRLVDWPFFPVLNGTDHPISKNLDGVRSMFPTTIDTVEASGLTKTFLLQSSNNTRLLQAPAKIDFEFLQIAPDAALFRQKAVPVSVLLEGTFKSLYTGRVSRAAADSLKAMNRPFLSTSATPTKMIVVADGDIATNQFSQMSGPLPMGKNLFTQYTFANKDFFTNCLEYLVNPATILRVRSKEYSLRLLDSKRVNEEKEMWQLINIALPIVLVILAGIVYQQLRKRRFSS